MGRRGSRWKPGDRPKGKNGLKERRITIEGQRYSLYASDPDTMQRREDKKRAEVKAGIYKTNETITLDQYFPEWLKFKEASIKSSTIFSYKQCFNNHISPYLGKCKVRKIERRQVMAMMAHIAESKREYVNSKTKKRKTVHTNKGRKVAAANFARRLLVSILNGALADDIVQRNVAITVPNMKRETPPAREGPHRELTDAELKTFFSFCERSRYYLSFKFMLYTGARAGECAGLKWVDVDWLRGIVHIRRTVTRDKEGHWIVGSTPKTRSSKRDIPMNVSVRKVLTKQWNTYRAIHGEVNLDDLVFPNENGGCAYSNIYSREVRYTLARIRKAGISMEPFSIHALRHTFASRARRDDVDLDTLKEILGHSSLAMTADLYAHISQNDKKEAMEKVQIADF